MRRDQGIWLAAVALAALLWCGCAGIISENVYEDGQVERLRFSSGENWSRWDQRSTKQDDACIMLKKESTF